MKRLIPIFVLGALGAVSVSTATASPFIDSATYPTTAPQPYACKYTEGTAVYSSPVVKNTDGTVYCHIDLATVPTGSHSGNVVAQSNVPGVTDSASVPFAFTLGQIVVPSGLQLVK